MYNPEGIMLQDFPVTFTPPCPIYPAPHGVMEIPVAKVSSAIVIYKSAFIIIWNAMNMP